MYLRGGLLRQKIRSGKSGGRGGGGLGLGLVSVSKGVVYMSSRVGYQSVALPVGVALRTSMGGAGWRAIGPRGVEKVCKMRRKKERR